MCLAVLLECSKLLRQHGDMWSNGERGLLLEVKDGESELFFADHVGDEMIYGTR